MISFIIPCYGSQDTISDVVNELTDTMKQRDGMEYEIILVNDASPDGVYSVINELCENDLRVKALDLAKNFGQHNAIMAGIKYAGGSTLIFLDDDGQNPGSELWKLVDALGDDCDVVISCDTVKQHNWWRNIGSRINNYMARVLINKPRDMQFFSFWACKRYVADEIARYNGSYPYIGGLLLRSVKRIKNIPIKHRERISGKSGYTPGKLLALWLNGFTAFSVKPLRIATLTGCVLATVGFIYGIIIIVRRLVDPAIALGFTSIMAAILLIGGMIMIMLGLIGEYVGRIYISINNSPQFVVREKIGFDDNDTV